jgi:hypothetical protein
VRDERQRRLCLVGYFDRAAKRGAARRDTHGILREHGRERFTGLDPLSGASRNHKPGCRVELIVERLATAAERHDAAPNGARLDARDESTPRRAEDLAFPCLW